MTFLKPPIFDDLARDERAFRVGLVRLFYAWVWGQ